MQTIMEPREHPATRLNGVLLMTVVLGLAACGCAQQRSGQIYNDLGYTITFSIEGPSECSVDADGLRLVTDTGLILRGCDLRRVAAFQYRAADECVLDMNSFRRHIRPFSGFSIIRSERVRLSEVACVGE